MTLVSVITPSLNQGQFIAQTIESVLGQDYPGLEYWVIDGGSTDSTRAVVQHYEPRVRWLSEPDSGQSAAINKGWRLTHGDIIAWLNADDTYLPHTISRIVEFFVSHPTVMAVFGDCDCVDALGRFLKPYPIRSYNYEVLVRSANNYIPQPATFIRRAALELIGGIDESLHYLMDFDYWLRLGMKSQMAYLPERLATLRLHEEAKSLRAFGNFASELVGVYQRLLASPNLPANLKNRRKSILHTVYYNAAHFSFWAGDITKARQYGMRSWRNAPFSLRWLWLLLPLGRRGLWLGEKMRGNPYRLTR